MTGRNGGPAPPYVWPKCPDCDLALMSKGTVDRGRVWKCWQCKRELTREEVEKQQHA